MNNKPLLMIVDDEVDITDTYATFFELHGYQVMTANDAISALVLLDRHTPGLIVSDCMMPYMDGVEFTRRVRALPALLHTSIILMSGAPELHDLDRAAYDIFLRKPVMLPQLLKEVRRLLA